MDDLGSQKEEVVKLRATITQQAQELEGHAARIDALRSHLSATITERDELNIAVTQGIRHRQEYVERIDALVIELAASQARCEEETNAAIIERADRINAQAQLKQLQATPAAREARIRELEDQMNAKRYVTNEAL